MPGSRPRTGRTCCAIPTRLPADIRAHLEAENAYSAGLIGRVSGLQAQLFAEMRGASRRTIPACPRRTARSPTTSRYRTGGQHPLYCRKPREPAATAACPAGRRGAGRGQALLPVSAAPPLPTTTGSWPGAATRRARSSITIRVRDIARAARPAPTLIDGHRPAQRRLGTQTAAVSSMSRVDENHRPAQVFRHRLGTPSSRGRAGL